jgi:hypothetical protein
MVTARPPHNPGETGRVIRELTVHRRCQAWPKGMPPELSDGLLRDVGLGAEPVPKLPSEVLFVPRPVCRLVCKHGVTGAGFLQRRKRRHPDGVGPGRAVRLTPAVPDDGVEVREALVNPATAAERNGDSNSCLIIVQLAGRV